jgi:hypothetical protein
VTVTATGPSVPLLLHAGAGSTWQAMVVVVGVVLAGVVLAAAIGRITISSRDDLLLPVAGAAIASSLGAVAHELLSDAIGWALPLAVVSLVALLLAAFTPLELRFPSPLAMGAVAVTIVAIVLLYEPLTVALHPPAELLPLADDSEVSIVAPSDGAEVAAGPVAVVVEVTGGSIGPGGVPLAELPDDPEEAGALLVALVEVDEDGTLGDQTSIDPDTASSCTVAEPCEQVGFDVEVPAGTYRLIVEFVRGDGLPLAPFVRDQVTFSAS